MIGHRTFRRTRRVAVVGVLLLALGGPQLAQSASALVRVSSPFGPTGGLLGPSAKAPVITSTLARRPLPKNPGGELPGVPTQVMARHTPAVKQIPPVSSTRQDSQAQKPPKPPRYARGQTPIARAATSELSRLKRLHPPAPVPPTSAIQPALSILPTLASLPTPAPAAPAAALGPGAAAGASVGASAAANSDARLAAVTATATATATAATATATATTSAAPATASPTPTPTPTPTATTPACNPAVKGKIYCENQLPGTPESVWDLPNADAGDPTLQGFATSISVNIGQTESFKVKSTAANYRLDIYRLGYYGGNGARLVASINPSVPYPQAQPACLTDATTGLIDCGNWGVSASWTVPTTAVSGLYIARLTRLDTGDGSHIPFVVRDDSSHSAVELKTSDATWTAYNNYGGNSLYLGSPVGRAYKVSYNRPYQTRVTEPNGWNWVFAAEYPMLRFLEANGYDVSYTTDVDTVERGSLIKNHKTFIASGHDEYWSQEERDSVTAARDAGVNLAFFSGNEVFWKTRWEPSLDSSHTSDRTMTCYKETQNASPIDPAYPGIWTGTWRDPRYSPPSNGGKPENALTGTMYMADPPTDFPMQVPTQYDKLRFWRNTAIATATTTSTLANATLGYEFDSDLDNGSRPAGVFDLSGETENVQNKLLDYGSATGPGTVVHHMTTYRAPSGALVFGAGSVQWAFGLDPVHDGVVSAADPRMQQATVNLLADMGAQPTSLIPGLVAATASTDHTPPTAALTSTAHPVVGTNYTLTGTAKDTGGVVAGVEVSTDGGITWHPATITAAAASVTWTYPFLPGAPGTQTIKIRAADDSANLESPVTATLTVNARTCPCTLFNNQVPVNASDVDASDVELGTRFRATINGTVTGVRFYKGSTANGGTHHGSLWTNNGQLLATGTFTNETASGWQTLTFAQPVAITAATTYVASYTAPSGHYAGDTQYFNNNSAYSAPLLGLADGVDGHNGAYHVYSAQEATAGTTIFPADSSRASNYWVDAVFNGDTSTDVAPPQVTVATPLAGSSSQPTSSVATAGFSKPFNPSSVTFTLTTGATAVAGTVSVDPGMLSATFTPTNPLAAGASYTATVSATDFQGHTLAPPFSWTFRTGAAQPPAGTCPCTVWSDQQQPGTVTTNDAGSVELGVKVRAATAGLITGIRFFKGPQNTGPHTGAVWSATGTKLASVTFTNETASGWQQATVDPPVTVTANTTYVVSYHAPVGYYSSSPGGLASSVSYGPLTALGDGVDGSDGLFTYGSSSVFPTSSGGSTNYWVDAVFATTAAPPTPPQVTSATPAPGWSGSALAATPRVVFDRGIDSASIAFTLKAGTTPVTGTVAYDATALAATFTPSAPLSYGTTYTATVTATGASGAAMTTPYTWSFTTGTPATCPCALWPGTATPSVTSANDSGSYEFGTRFSSDVSATVTGVTFYKGAGNTGTHTGSIWSPSGVRLVTGTFTNETATGWQTLTFTTPLHINAGTQYVASYFAPLGHYSYDVGYFSSADSDAAPLHAPATATGPNGVFDASATSAFPGDSYNATNYWVSPVITTVAAPVTCPCTLFGAQVPPGSASTENASLELGTRFTAERAGTVTGVRFYKSTTNSGTHTGSLWSAAGSLLATGTFANETASGWQTLTFTTPVAITAGTVYTVSYHTAVGAYYATADFFDSDYDSPPLHAPSAGGNGVFLYGPSGFPTGTFSNSNYWVDVIFT